MSTCIMNLQKRCVSFDVSESICIESVIARALDILTSDGAQLKKGERERERERGAFLTNTSLRKAIFRRSKVVIKTGSKGFPGCAVVKNLPANAGDTGSSPGPGRSHMLQSN